MRTHRYILNCFWLLTPAIVLLIAFAGLLPAAFQADLFWAEIPQYISLPESVLRLAVFALPAFMPLHVGKEYRLGWALYALGMGLYVAAWLALIWLPESGWSQSMAGVLAPAYTPLIWLFGVGLIGRGLYWPRLPFKPWMYSVLVVVFTGFHVAHTWLVFSRL